MDVNLKITTEAQLEGVKAAEAEISKLSATSSQASAGAEKLTKSHESLSGVSRPLKAGLAQIVDQLGLEGPAAHVAAVATLHLSEGLTAVTGASLAAALGIGAAISSIKGVKESFKAIDESFDPKKLEQTSAEIQILQEHIAGLGTYKGIIWEMLTVPMETYGDAVARTLGLESASEQKLAALKAGQIAAVRQLTSELELEAKARQKVAEAELRGDTLGALSAQQTASAQALRKILESKGVSGVPVQEAVNALKETFPTDRQLTITKAGLALLAQGFKELGLDAGMTKAELVPLATAAFYLNQAFEQGRLTQLEMSAGLRMLAEGAIEAKASVGSLVEEVKGYIQLGNQKFTLKELAPTGGGALLENQIRAALNEARSQISDLTKYGAEFGFLDPGKLQQLKDQLQGFGGVMDKEFGIDAPKDIQATQQSLSGLVDKLAQKYSITLNAATATDAINKANEALNNLRSNASQPIIIRTQVSPGGSPSGPGAGGVQLGFTGSVSVDPKTGVVIPAGQDLRAIQKAFSEGVTLDFKGRGSPTLPLSEYLGNYAPSLIEAFADKAAATSITFDTNITNMMGSVLGQIVDAKEAIAKWSADIPFRADFVGDFTTGPRGRLAALEDTLKYLERMGTRTAAPAATGGGGGGGGPIIINNNFYGPITQEVLDRDFFPKFEKTLRATTGKAVTYTVQN